MLSILKNLFSKKKTETASHTNPLQNLELVDRFITSLVQLKTKELKENYTKGLLTKEEMNRCEIFKYMVLTAEDKVSIIMDDYSPIEYRLKELCDHKYYDEATMLSTLFLVGDQKAKYLYRKELDVSKVQLKGIIYFFCIALLNTNRKEICKVYIELLQKFVTTYPDKNNPPQEMIDKIGFRAHSSLFNQ